MFKLKSKSFFAIKKNKIFQFKKKDYLINEIKNNEIIIKIKYSSLNYRDFLVSNGKYWDARNYPLIPGSDCSGEVINSKSKKFKIGDKVVVIASPAGSKINGGFSEFLKIHSKWATKIPKGLSEKDTMVFGTAGFTAMYIINKILKSKLDKKVPILVTGGTGGVGSIAIFYLSNIGFKVIASTRSQKNKRFLKSIGAKEVILNKSLIVENELSLQKKMFSTCIDSVGGHGLSYVIKRIANKGKCYIVGFGNSNEISAINLTPFILRGVELVGINTESINSNQRKVLWQKISIIHKAFKYPKSIFKEVKFNFLKKELKQFNNKKTSRLIVKTY